MSRKSPLKSKRANSPVVAGAFFLAAVLIVFNAIFLVSSQYGSFMSDNLGKNESEIARRAERLGVSRIAVYNQKLNLTLVNRGPLPAHIVDIWISEWNKTTSNWHRNRPVSIYISAGETFKNIGQDFPDTVDPRLTYVLRIITSRGNVFPATYAPLSSGVNPGFGNLGFLSISFDPDSFLYTSEGNCNPVSAWEVPASYGELVWRIQVTNHGTQDIRLYKWSTMSFVKIASGSGSSSVNQEAFFVVGQNACDGQVGPPDTVDSYTVDDPNDPNPYIIPRNPQNDTQTGGNATWVRFAASTAGGDTTQNISWAVDSEYMIFMVFYFLYGTNEFYTQVIPFAGVHFTS